MKTKKTIVCGFLAVILALAFIACGDDPDPTPQTVTYSGTANGTTYTLKITENLSRAAYTPQAGDSYVLTAGTKKSTGTVVSYSNGTFTLKPEGSATTFTASVSSSGLTGFTGGITWEGESTPTTLPTEVTPIPPPNTGNPSGGNIAPFVLTGVQATDSDGNNSTLTKDFHYIFSSGDRISDLIENPSVKLINGKVSISFDKPKNWNPQSGNLFFIYLTFADGDNDEVLLGYGRNGINASPGGNVLLVYTETARTLTKNDMLGSPITSVVYEYWETVNLNVSLQRGWNYMVVSYDDRDTVTISSGEPNSEFEWFVYVNDEDD